MTATAATDILQHQLDQHAAMARASLAPSAPPGAPFTWLRTAVAVATRGKQSPPPPISEVDPLSRLALLLAHERTKGRGSFWAPYISNLPGTPPCPWFLPEEQLPAALRDLAQTHGLNEGVTQGWVAAVRRAGAVARVRAAALAAAYGAALGVDAEGIAWALGHVASRAFGDGEDVALAPLIDSCNHQDGAGKPWPLEVKWPDGGGEGGEGLGDGSGGQVLVCITPEVDGEVRGLAAGDELCISYGRLSGKDRDSALGTYINFGFLP